MAGGRLSQLIACGVVGLLGVFLHHDVEASEEVIHKMVGEAVELSLNQERNDVTWAEWRFGMFDVTTSGQFEGRAEVDPLSFSLTVRELTLQDSGKYDCLSEVNRIQQPTVTIHLHVHAPINDLQATVVNSTWNATTQSCSVFLECGVITPGDVSFTWTGAGQSRHGAALQHVLRPEDGDAEFNCTASNPVSGKWTSVSVLCSNETVVPHNTPESTTVLLAAAAGASLLFFVIVCAVATVCCRRRKRAGAEPDESTLYAVISELLTSNGPDTYTNTNSGNNFSSIDVEKPQPSTVYDEIQLRRMRKESVSPYQEIY